MRKALVLSTLLAALLAGTARAAVPCDPSPVAGFACTVSDPEGT